MQLNQNHLQKLDHLEAEYAKYAILFEDGLPSDTAKIRQVCDDIKSTVDTFAPVVEELQRLVSFGTESDKNRVTAAHDQLNELKTYIRMLSAKLPSFRPSI